MRARWYRGRMDEPHLSAGTRRGLVIAGSIAGILLLAVILLPRILQDTGIAPAQERTIGPCTVTDVRDESWRTKNGSWIAVDTSCGGLFATNETLTDGIRGTDVCLRITTAAGQPAERILGARSADGEICSDVP